MIGFISVVGLLIKCEFKLIYTANEWLGDIMQWEIVFNIIETLFYEIEN